MIQSEIERLQKEGKVENVATPGLTIDELASRVDRIFTENQMSPVDKNDIQMFLYLLRGIKQHITSAPTNIPKNFLQQIEFYDDGTEKRLYLFINNAWTKISSNQLLSKGVAMFTGTASDLGGTYYKMSEISTYSVGSTASATTSVTTSPTLMGTFATISTYPNIVTIPVGTIVGHFETEKASGSNNYYTYFELYKRTSGGTETLIATSDRSTEVASNTAIQQTVSAFINSAVTLNATDRLVVKVYGVLLSASANVTLRWDDNISARVEFPYYQYS